MKQRLMNILNADKSTDDYAGAILDGFGLSVDKHYDLLVVAPGWIPTKIVNEPDVTITQMAEHSYISGYEVKTKDSLIGWIQVSAGASSLIDRLSMCVFLDFDKLVFVGAVGALVPEIPIGTLCTPKWCIAGTLANGYLQENLEDYKPFGKVFPNDPDFVDKAISKINDMGYEIRQEPVFCTDSFMGEYAHLDFIKSFGARIIEMETCAFYEVADLMEKPAIALLAVSDNSATGDSVIVRTKEQKEKYNSCRKGIIPKILLELAKM